MVEQRVQRRIATILAADVVGFSRMMEVDEAGTLAALKARRRDVLDPQFAEHQGRIFKTTGDGVLVEFSSAVNAVQCAVDLQQAMAASNGDQPEDRHIVLRIGVNLGDVMVEDDDLYGDGVNIAARLEALADPGGILVSGTAYDHVGTKVKVEFDDVGAQNLKNIAQPVRAYRVKGLSNAAVLAQKLVTDKPSIAVMPFTNMSGDPEQDFFADGLVEDIITTLSKLAGLRVIARNSSFVYKGQAVDVREAAKRLGVRYVLEGSVRKSANRIRITAQLIDATSGSHVWAERYDRAMDDIFAVQDEITMVLATEMQVNLIEGEQARLHYTTTSNIEAWTHWVKGLSYFRGAVTKENTAAALSCWQRALALEPDSAALNAMVGFIHYIDARFGWWDDRHTALEKALGYADRALQLDPGNPDANTTSSFALLLQGRYDEAAVHARRATHLAPGSADAATFACFVLAFSGYPEEAVVHGEKAMTLSPNCPAFYHGHLGNAYRLAGRIEDAIAAFKTYNALHAGFGLTDLVIAYQQIDQLEAAKRTAKQLLSIRRDFTITGWANTQFRADTARLQADIAALHAAALPMN